MKTETISGSGLVSVRAHLGNDGHWWLSGRSQVKGGGAYC